MEPKPRPKRRYVPNHVLRARHARLQRAQALLRRENMALRDPASFYWACLHVDMLLAAVTYGPRIPGAADTSSI